MTSRSGGQKRAANDPGETGRAAAGFGDKLNVWGGLSLTDMAFKYAPAQSSGNSTLGLIGADYLFAPDMLAGVVLSLDRNRIGFNPAGIAGRADGNGYMVTPYLAWQPNRNWLIDASLGFGRAEMKIKNNAIAGTTDDHRRNASISASYVTTAGNLDLTGKASLVKANNKIDSYVDWNVINAATSAHTTQLRLGGRASYGKGEVTPYAGVYYITDLDRDKIAGAANDRDGFQIALGLNFFSKGALSGGVMLSTEAGRSQVRNNQLVANIAIRF